MKRKSTYPPAKNVKMHGSYAVRLISLRSEFREFRVKSVKTPGIIASHMDAFRIYGESQTVAEVKYSLLG